MAKSNLRALIYQSSLKSGIFGKPIIGPVSLMKVAGFMPGLIAVMASWTKFLLFTLKYFQLMP